MRYVTVKGFIHKNKLIPIWDTRVIYKNDEMYGEIFELENIYGLQQLVDLIFDTETKSLKLGIEINYYIEPEFLIGTEVYHETRLAHRELKESKIIDIKYEKYEIRNMNGKQLSDNLYFLKGQDIQIDYKSIYSIKEWEPTYIMEDGYITNYTHQIYKKCKG